MRSSYLDSFPVVRTTDPEQMRAALLAQYGARDFDYPAGVDGFFGCGNHLQLSGIGLSFCAYKSAVKVSFDATGAVRQQFCLRGSAATLAGGRTFEIHPDRSYVLNANQAATVNFGVEYEQLVLRIDEKFLADKFAALTGRSPPAALLFDGAVDLDTPEGRGLKQVVLMLAGLFSATNSVVPPILSAELEQMAATALLSCNGHNFTRFFEGEPQDAATWQVRCIEDYIEANWNTPITVEKLAQIANVSVRSIFKAFKANRGYSPMAFAKQVRLKRAREMLLTPELRTSVVGVAFVCGFSNPGHFARDYRSAFGELPSATRKRAKGLLIS